MMPTSIEIIKKLRRAGYEAYWAGGCVRDILLGIQPKDYDIVTSAKPDEIEKILAKTLEKTIPIGKQFGVMIGVKNGHHFEIATFRSDSGYSDGRRPDAVTFTSAKEDAKRRDFTINGMFFDPVNDKIFDYVGGQKDLDAGLIRFIGDPHERILEDHLRILRAIRFKNEFNFQYEPKTYTALHKHTRLVIDKVARERVQIELNKMLMTPRAASSVEDMEDIGVLEIILPEIHDLKGIAQPTQYHLEGDVWTHTVRALRTLPETAPLAVRWAVLLHDSGKPDTFELKERIRFDHHVEFSKKHAQKVLGRLRYPRKFIEEVCWLVEHHMIMVPLVEMAEGRKRHWFLHPWFLNLMQVFKADAEGTTPTDLALYEKIFSLYRASLKKMPVLPAPLLHGEDVMKVLGIKPGKKVGEIMAEIKEKQLEGKIKTKKQALAWIKKKA
jgi:tRNA nucleotidyltransferase/poly(A) polymerase